MEVSPRIPRKDIDKYTPHITDFSHKYLLKIVQAHFTNSECSSYLSSTERKTYKGKIKHHTKEIITKFDIKTSILLEYTVILPTFVMELDARKS